MNYRPLPGPEGLFNVSRMPRFLTDSSAVDWQGAFFTDIVAATEGRVDHGHTRFSLQRSTAPVKNRELKPGSTWSAMAPGIHTWGPGDEQRLDWVGGGGRQFLFIEPGRVEEILEVPAQRVAHFIGAGAVRNSPIADLIIQALTLDLIQGSPAGSLVGDALIVSLVAHLCTGEADSRCREGLAPAVRERVLAYIQAHLDEAPTLAALAAVAGMSVRQFCRAFRGSTGCSPHQYVLRQRVEQAKALIARGAMPLAEVAQQLGFADQSQFTRTFRRLTGATPAAYRSAR